MSKSAAETDKVIGELIRETRICMGLSQTKLAERVGITLVQMGRYENGRTRVSLGRLADICLAMNIDPADIVTAAITRSRGENALSADRSLLEMSKRAAMLSPDTRSVMSALTARLAEVGA